MRIGERRSRIRIFSGVEAKGNLGSVKTTWSETGTEWGGFFPEYQTLRSYGAGEVPLGMREIEFGDPSRVALRAGLEVTGGPESGTRWRVIGIDHSRPGKTMVRAEPFNAPFA